MTTSTTTENVPESKRYEAWYPLHQVEQIPFFVKVLTELVVVHHGNLSTAMWEVNDNFLDYGYYQLLVTFDLRTS